MVAPRTVGRYEILDELARGGMGAVHRAWQPSLGRMVAIKTLLPGFAGDRDLEVRFQNEAGAIAHLSHENIVRIHDALQEADGTWYIVMELVEGPSLRRVLDGVGSLSPGRAADLARQAAEALSLAHGCGVVHRDIKPANLLLSDGGILKVMDFGIAKVAASKLQTVAGMVLGTPAYMSPEQAMGETVDGRSDIYSLATLLFEMLTGTRPFHDEDPIRLALCHIGQPPPDPRELRPGLPEALAKLVLRGLAKNRSARFQSAAELSAALAPVALAGRRSLPAAGLFAPQPSCPICQAAIRAHHDRCPACDADLATVCLACLEPHHVGYLACPYCWQTASAPPAASSELARAVATLRCGGCDEMLDRDFLRCPFCGREVEGSGG